MTAAAADSREVKFRQDPSSFNFGQNRYSRTDSFDAHCRAPSVINNVISLLYFVHTYSAGAAHGMQGYLCFSFFLDPIVQIDSLDDIFDDTEKALSTILPIVRKQLIAGLIRDGRDENSIDVDWIQQGTDGALAFSLFTFADDGIEFLFPPYQVASYADGPRSAKVSKWDAFALMKSHLVAALGWEHLRWQERPQRDDPDAVVS